MNLMFPFIFVSVICPNYHTGCPILSKFESIQYQDACKKDITNYALQVLGKNISKQVPYSSLY